MQVRLTMKKKFSTSLSKSTHGTVPYGAVCSEKVNSSEWATPIVPVQKRNNKDRICGDFSVTVNKQLRNIHNQQETNYLLW